tara:strand:- start:132 stop:374 length:243 start_codon:yes stop_codon:yes gene_type:complete
MSKARKFNQKVGVTSDDDEFQYISVRAPGDLKSRIQELADASSMSLTHYIIRLLEFAEQEKIHIVTKFEMQPNKEMEGEE